MATLPWMKLRPGTFAALALLVSIVAAGSAGMLAVRTYMQQLADAADATHHTVARLRTAIDAGNLQKASGSAAVSTGATAAYLSGPQAPVILAGLQSQLRTLALKRGVELNSTNNLPARNEQKLEYLGLRATFRGQLQEIQALLHEIESATPFLFVERAILRVDNWPLKSADPARNGAPAIIAELDIWGARLPDRDTAKAGSQRALEAVPERGPLPLTAPGNRSPAPPRGGRT